MALLLVLIPLVGRHWALQPLQPRSGAVVLVRLTLRASAPFLAVVLEVLERLRELAALRLWVEQAVEAGVSIQAPMAVLVALVLRSRWLQVAAVPLVLVALARLMAQPAPLVV